MSTFLEPVQRPFQPLRALRFVGRYPSVSLTNECVCIAARARVRSDDQTSKPIVRDLAPVGEIADVEHPVDGDRSRRPDIRDLDRNASGRKVDRETVIGWPSEPIRRAAIGKNGTVRLSDQRVQCAHLVSSQHSLSHYQRAGRSARVMR